MNTLANVLPGRAGFAWVELPAGVRPEGLIGREVGLERLGPALIATYILADGSVREHQVRGRSAADDATLRDMVTENSRVMAFAGDIDTGRWLHLRVYEIIGRFEWGELRVGADEKTLGSVKRITGAGEERGARGWGESLNWLRRQLLFPPPPGRAASPLDMAAPPSGTQRRRLVAVVRPNQDLTQPVSCKLIGAEVVATLKQENGEWRLRQVHHESRQAREFDRTALIEVDVEIYNATAKAGLRRKMKEELTRLGSDEGEQTFMAIWRRYHEMEDRYALRRLAELDFLEYSGWSYQDDSEDGEDVIRFTIVPGRDKLLTRVREELSAGHETDLECSVQLPEVLGGSGVVDPYAGLLGLDLVPGNMTGAVVNADEEERFVDLRMVRHGGDDERQTEPPGRGFLHAAIRGDRRRLERRNRALRRLLNEHIPLPQLLSLLQGTAVRGNSRRPVPAMSAAAEACFAKRNPNAEQRLALDTALNTPDIAIIQGPPGTGKTQLIAALQIRLAEEGRDHAVVSRSVLLTSYQHAAVDNLVERSNVWDLPAVKIDSQSRGSTAHIENWRLATIRGLKEEVNSTPEGRRSMVLRAVARQTADYCRAPMPVEELARVLGRTAEQVSGLVSDELLGRLRQLVAELAAATRVAGFQADHRRASTLRAVRGIRCLPESFGDDGPLKAAAALTFLDHVPAVDERHRELLRRAADWLEFEPPPFLAELSAVRDELLDRLTDRADRLFRPAAREDVVDLLNDIVDDLSSRSRATTEGVRLALLEYLDELEGDPEAVLATLRLYTTSLAATCQQADSPAVQAAKDGERLFDTVIVDEAARANPLDLLIPLTLATRRVVLVGDQDQLPHMLEPDVEHELRSDDSQELATLRESLFGRLFTLLHDGDDTPGPRRAVRLRSQYRMHQVLGNFVGHSFYRDTLHSPRPDEDFSHQLDGYDDRPAAWLRVPQSAGREHAGQSKARRAEARAIAKELSRHMFTRPDLKFGVISFYSAQVRLIWEELVKEKLAERHKSGFRPVEDLRRDADGSERIRLQVGTVDAFQGKQFDVVLLSIARSSQLPDLRPAQREPDHPGHADYEEWARRAYGHLMLRNRLCVAMSRQERLLVVVGDDAMFTTPLVPKSLEPLRDFHALCVPPTGVVLNPGS
ncbi:AAA domain-containing protein [Nonomuraea wenchangensis]